MAAIILDNTSLTSSGMSKTVRELKPVEHLPEESMIGYKVKVKFHKFNDGKVETKAEVNKEANSKFAVGSEVVIKNGDGNDPEFATGKYVYVADIKEPGNGTIMLWCVSPVTNVAQWFEGAKVELVTKTTVTSAIVNGQQGVLADVSSGDIPEFIPTNITGSPVGHDYIATGDYSTDLYAVKNDSADRPIQMDKEECPVKVGDKVKLLITCPQEAAEEQPMSKPNKGVVDLTVKDNTVFGVPNKGSVSMGVMKAIFVVLLKYIVVPTLSLVGMGTLGAIVMLWYSVLSLEQVTLGLQYCVDKLDLAAGGLGSLSVVASIRTAWPYMVNGFINKVTEALAKKGPSA